MSVVPLSLFRDGRTAERSRHDTVTALARDASIEINVPELKYLDSSRALLAAGKRMYISHLPKQSWEETIAASRAVRAAGFEPVPHVPVRILADRQTAERVIGALHDQAQVVEVLVIAGDYAETIGPYSAALDLMATGLLGQLGMKRVSFAGHPEGHPRAALDEIRRAEVAKARWADEVGIASSIVTQFFFESAPFVDWVRDRRDAGVRSRIIAGIAGPASIAKLVRFAMRCGVGRSVRALAATPNVMTRLLEQHGPEKLLGELADAQLSGLAAFDGIHVFGFGGYLKTCEWLQRVAAGDVALDN